MKKIQQTKKLILLVNLGSPNSLKVSAIRDFLKRFLSDKRVVGLSKIIWYPILYGIILPFRAKKLIHLYKKIWLKNNVSPLVYYTGIQAKQLEYLIKQDNNKEVMVRATYLYSKPLIGDVINELTNIGVNIQELVVIPMYPQYSSTTIAPVFDVVLGYYKNKLYIPKLKLINGFYKNKLFINAITNKIHRSWSALGRGDILLFSYHSLPVKLINNGDTYFNECMETTSLIAHSLGLQEHEFKTTFQSKFGKGKWLEPNTAKEIKSLAVNGVKKIDVVCPGFVADCLETLEEINVEARHIFLNNGGVIFNYIECLNDGYEFTELLKNEI